jgi:hypothetical protein
MSDIAISVEKQYTINEVSDLLKMSFSTVRLLVKDEPGVLRFQTSKRGAAKRTRTMYRIPESVLERIIRRCTNPEMYHATSGRRI